MGRNSSPAAACSTKEIGGKKFMKCPRCDSEKARIMTKSPVGDAWEIYVCDHCCYSWRSTENIQISEIFKLNDEKIANMGIIPPIPPLKK
jgi:hypothetical protein